MDTCTKDESKIEIEVETVEEFDLCVHNDPVYGEVRQGIVS